MSLHSKQDNTKSASKILSVSEIDKLSSQLLELDLELNSNIPTTLWISDLHGEGDRFKSILRGRFGMLYQTCKEALPNTFSEEKLQYLSKIIRKKSYFPDAAMKMDMQDVILCLVDILKYKLANIRLHSSKIFRPEFRDVINRLMSGLPVPDPIFEEKIIADRLIAHLSHTIRQILLDRIQVLGDVFDRGDQPDKILRILSSHYYRDGVDYVFGNHDILWMGAAAGCSSLVAEALRITCRYDHFIFLERLGFDTSQLASFAEKTYPVDLVTGNFKAKTDKGRSMEKALAIIQFKLEEQTIRDFPQYEMSSRLWLDKLAEILRSKDVSSLNDAHFPTLDLDNPGKLADEEAEIIADLTVQFTTNRKLMRLLQFLFSRGKTYHIQNNFLNIHALVPSTAEGEFEEFLGRKGKHLLEYIQETIQRVGLNYIEGKPQNIDDQSLFFYLWCGPKSPFFGKHAMKTFERYFLIDKKSHEERSLFWKDNMQTDKFKRKMQQEFGVQRVIFGHTPVDYKKGIQMASEDGVAINVDGGFAAAYYNRGHSLVHTPHQLYGIILPTPEEIKVAEKKLESAPLDIELIDEFREPMKIKDTIAGKKLLETRNEIMSKLRECSGDQNSFNISHL
ncbi:fructose-bisphosphatase class III [Desulforhopalus sp. IMCC35007]|uniref:fructose-bisphosphatase class III n=1 Tax=Desulforhopalus sp. IMCC35007 TaxID=2569543 RepID=UPI0010AECC44|nr:fructose-bisphosphatase class III [Desulforhopalus sp. IMCC35007]TKB08981.1 fructose-1,6-bisphosphatase [Desulforhopalus sp. IMCC35007]